MKNNKDESKAEGCAQNMVAGIVLVVMIPVGYVMNALGFSIGWIIGFGIFILILCLSITAGK
jgi:hypothetical protein